MIKNQNTLKQQLKNKKRSEEGRNEENKRSWVIALLALSDIKFTQNFREIKCVREWWGEYTDAVREA